MSAAEQKLLDRLRDALRVIQKLENENQALQRARSEPIAIVGMSCRFPGGQGPDEFWQLLRDGRETVGEIPPQRWDTTAYFDPDPEAPGKMYVRRGGFLDQI